MTWFEPVLGTVLQTSYEPASETDRYDEVCLETISGLDLIFSRYRDDSELMRFNAGALERDGLSIELRYVLAMAERFRDLSGGALDAGLPPDLDLDAIAKGYIVDRAAVAVATAGAWSVLVNIGGDLVHQGPVPVEVGIEDPRTPYDNAPPLTTVKLAGRALATSGIARRGQHIRDPRTGQPSTATLSVTVIADSALVADALATVTGVLGLAAAQPILTSHAAEALVVTAEGVAATPGWAAYEG
ncbi:MAG TPA: FAD:protein FMN transferase [Propionibacteriaceae bacterium]|nr:FAD:protein FMN transferase [Propionibacteriaceae bacterium]HPZ50460.1 FAD:protein FMN transferase [Propionibacteriaceae bacterium]HQE31887.1 FAD:protein FMN transferase [Propionibacteriaceae bacterium]